MGIKDGIKPRLTFGNRTLMDEDNNEVYQPTYKPKVLAEEEEEEVNIPKQGILQDHKDSDEEEEIPITKEGDYGATPTMPEDTLETRRSTRVHFAPERLEPKLMGKSYAQMTQVEDPKEYILGYCLAEVYSLVKGIKEFRKNWSVLRK